MAISILLLSARICTGWQREVAITLYDYGIYVLQASKKNRLNWSATGITSWLWPSAAMDAGWQPAAGMGIQGTPVGFNASDPAADPKVLAGHSDRINTLAFSPDNHWLASGSGDQTVRLWNVGSPSPGADPLVLRGHANHVNTLAFSEDKQWLATGSDDGTALLWDLTAHNPAEEPIHLSDHQGPVKTLAFSPDSHWLATGSGDNTIRLWLVRFEDLKNLACQIAGRNLTHAEWNKLFPQQTYHKTCKQWPEGH